MPARRLLVAMVTALLAVTAIGACGEAADEPRVHQIVVPEGTMGRLSRGEAAFVMPSVLTFEVGDTIRIRNEDVVDQSVGPYFVPAGEELELTYGAPGHYEGYCPLTEDQRYEIIVTE